MHATKKSVITSEGEGMRKMNRLHVNFFRTGSNSKFLSLICSESLSLIGSESVTELNWQVSFSSTQTPLGWSKGKKARVTWAPHSMIWYFVSWLWRTHVNSGPSLLATWEAAIDKQRSNKLVFVVFIFWLLEAYWPQLNNWQSFMQP